MAIYKSDGRKLIDVEYDIIPKVNDTIDEMRVLFVDTNTHNEHGVFLLEPNARVTCYVFDEIFILGKAEGFENLSDALSAWRAGEI
jgi:hypothetical protein